jgi:hypothetical protein
MLRALLPVWRHVGYFSAQWSANLVLLRADSVLDCRSALKGHDLITSHHSEFIFRKKRFVVPTDGAKLLIQFSAW